MTQNDVIIIGGGIIGASLAYWLASHQDRGSETKITLVEANAEPAFPGTASAASAGIISPDSNLNTPPAMLELTQRSLTLYPQLIAQLKAEQPDLPTGYTELGQLSLAANGAEVRGLQKRLQWFLDGGYAPQARWLTTQEVSELEPLAGPNAGALYQPVATVRPAWLTRTLVRAASQKGVQILKGNPAVSLEVNRSNRLKATGVKLKNGDILSADKIVLAAGSWSGVWLDQQLANLDINLSQEQAGRVNYAEQIYPVRGQMLSVQIPSGQSPLRHVLVGSHGYAVPRLDYEDTTTDGNINNSTVVNTVAFGATEEHDAGFIVQQTPEGYRELGLLVHKLTPMLEKYPVRESWAGLRPGSKSTRPSLGPILEMDGLWLSSGHFRSGILLAPATAELLADALLNGSNRDMDRLKSLTNFVSN